LCQCQHISPINTLHCLQSLEKPGAAQVEGYAHNVVGRTWNALEQSDCVFPYYKHFLSPACVVNPADCTPDPVSGLIVNSPPVATSCIDPIKWRNNQCLSGTPMSSPDGEPFPARVHPVQGIRDGAEALLLNGTITAEQRTQLLQMGNTFGVSEATAP
jgi:hypothetical protein